MTRLARWIVLAAVAGGLLYAAALAGWLQVVIDADATGIVWGTMGLTALTFAVALRTPKYPLVRFTLLDWVCEHGLTLLLGLLGTLVGFMTALAGVTEGDLVQKLAGVETALATTIVGLVCHIWLLIVSRVLK